MSMNSIIGVLDELIEKSGKLGVEFESVYQPHPRREFSRLVLHVSKERDTYDRRVRNAYLDHVSPLQIRLTHPHYDECSS